MANDREKMHTGDLYLPTDDTIIAEQTACLEKLYGFNATRPSEMAKRQQLLKEMFAILVITAILNHPYGQIGAGTMFILGMVFMLTSI